jgi:hypothetical protein
VSVLSSGLRKQLESGVLAARRAAELGARSAIGNLGVFSDRKPDHVTGDAAALRNGLRAKWRQLGLENELLVAECAFEQWHRLLFARFLAENGLLLHPVLNIPVTLDECEELAGDLGEPDGWSVAARFASQILPGIFRLDDPCVRIRLAPEHRIALEVILAALPVEVFTADDSLGWVYQYWQKDSKDEVNASERKVGGADLGPVTQLFTENYMVRFLLENSLGAWWAARHPQSPLVKSWEYLRFNEDGAPAAGTFDGWPPQVAEVTVMDPCCGSGHFLVDAFGMLWRMRAEEDGLSPIEAQDAVLRDNLFGLELDPRCVQIAMFAVAFQAWKDGGGWRELPTPNIACSGIPVKTPLKEWTALANSDERLEGALTRLHLLFRDADTLGSLIDPRRAIEGGKQQSFDDVEWGEILPLLETVLTKELDPASSVLGAEASSLIRAVSYLSEVYTLVSTNPPFLHSHAHSSLLRSYCEEHYPLSKGELATVFLDRIQSLLVTQGSSVTVSPQNWTFLGGYRRFRQRLLQERSIAALVGLGPGAFSGISGAVVQPVLTIVNNQHPTTRTSMIVAEVRDGSVDDRARGLRTTGLSVIRQQEQASNPDCVLTFVTLGGGKLLSEFADGLVGVQTGDNQRFVRECWEIPEISSGWVPLQGTPAKHSNFDGRSQVLLWEEGKGRLISFVQQQLGVGRESAWIRGRAAWGRRGVVMSSAGLLPSALYSGQLFLNSAVVVLAGDESLLPAVFAFCSDAEYHEAVRRIDKKLLVTNKTTVKVPFDAERWRAVAAERFPDGLPEPWSDDPTQWLFEGRPEVSTSPLQVAVGRLLGFRWPEQPEHDDLDQFADADGIVCLPSVAGEAPAAEQLADLLSAAYGTAWNAGTLSKLLAAAGSKKKTLADWLRDEFFKQHCSVFGNRPFVWHVWDGHPQGFSALVNYHRLDHKALEKLTYTYLGTDWMERQRAAVRDDEPGAEARLAAAESLKTKLELILKGEAPHDIYVRWKPLEDQPLGWEPDLDDGVRLNVRPFVEAGVLRSSFNIHWKKDRGTNPDGSERLNDIHVTLAEKQQARKKDR